MGLKLERRWMVIGGVNLAEFNCYLLNPGIASAPERDVELVTVPGRNGDVVIDNHRFKNHTVQYKCAIDGSCARYDFERLTAWLKSLTGYQRIEECYHPESYRMGVFNASIEPDKQNTRQVTFTLTANCKPQKFLIDGEKESEAFVPLFADGLAYYTSDLLAQDTSFENETCVLIQKGTTQAQAFENVAHINVWRAYGSGTSTTYTGAQARALVQMDGTTATIDLFALTGHGNAYTYYQIVFTNNNIDYWFKASRGTTARIVSELKLINPTFYDAKPLIHYYSSQSSGADGAVPAIVINGIDIDADGFNGDLYLDCETQNAYLMQNGVRSNGNQYITLAEGGEVTTDFPVLIPGTNTISMIPAVTIQSDIRLGECLVYIAPRWWTA